MEEPYIGMIALWSSAAIPKGWALCDGSLLQMSTNQALFSVLGTRFGGNGQTTFALPDLRGRVPIGAGQRTDGSAHTIGDMGGSEGVILQISEIPPHSHNLRAVSMVGGATSFGGGVVLAGAGTSAHVATSPAIYGAGPPTPMGSNSVVPAPGGQAHENRQPFLVLNYIIALQGHYPSKP